MRSVRSVGGVGHVSGAGPRMESRWVPAPLTRVVRPRQLALGGIIGPWVWALVVVLLTVLEYDTLLAFGWTPGQDNGVNYPSSLALGRAGWLQMLNFALFGLATIGLAAALHGAVRPRGAVRP